MSLIVDTRDDITLDALRRVAIGRETVRLSAPALARIAAAHEGFQRCVEANAGGYIYMITSGSGPEAKRHYSLDAGRERRKAHLRSWGPFGGPPLPEYVSRGAVFASLASIVAGHAAFHPERAEAVARLLDAPLPCIPSRGITAAGELMPNRILMPKLPADDRLTAGWGFHTEAAMAGIAALIARRRLLLAERVFALSIEGFQAPLEAYDPALRQIWGDDPHEGAALDALDALLTGAETKRRPYQAPISFRVLPKVLGQARRALSQLEEVASIGLKVDKCNPTYVLPDERHPHGRTISNGGFHNAAAAPAIDAIAAVWANLGVVAHKHAVKMHRGDISLLPDRLLPEGAEPASGMSTTYMEYVPTGYVEEMRRLAQPTLIPTSDIAASQQDDLAITTPLAFVNERRVAECFDAVMAVLAVIASQALHVTGRAPAPPLRPMLDAVRAIFPPVDAHRSLGPDCERLAAEFARAIDFGKSPFLPAG